MMPGLAVSNYYYDDVPYIKACNQPAIILWAAEIDYKPELRHAIWFDWMKYHIAYGIFDDEMELLPLAYINLSDDKLHCSDTLREQHGMRLTNCLQWVREQWDMYQWVDLRNKKSLEDVYKFFEYRYGSRKSDYWFYDDRQQHKARNKQEKQETRF